MQPPPRGIVRAAFAPALSLRLPSPFLPTSSLRRSSASPSPYARPLRVAPRAAAFKLSSPVNANVIAEVATARAVTPMRRPRSSQGQGQGQANSSDGQYYAEEPVLPSAGRTDLMAPARSGPWVLIPYIALCVVVGALGWVGKKKLDVRQAGLVDDFGEVMVYYGNTPESMREICSDYKRRLGPGIMRGALFKSYLRNLVTEKAVGPAMITDVKIVMRLLGIKQGKAGAVFNALGADLKDSPSLLGKLLFLADRALEADAAASLALVPLFPYGEATVVELQRNMVDRCFRDIVNRDLDCDDATKVDMATASALRLTVEEAEGVYNEVILTRTKAAEDARAAVAAAEIEDASKPDIGDLDAPARSGEPAKASTHAFQCTVCGYTMFPAAGREFKFFGDEFVCPTCGAPKDKFVDANSLSSE